MDTPAPRSNRRALTLLLLTAIALPAATVPPSVAGGHSTVCRVRNVTQGTWGGSFARMVSASRRGDRLRVRGHCVSLDVVIRHDLTITGVEDAILHGDDEDRVLRVATRATVVVRHLRLSRGRASDGGAIINRGHLTLIDVVVQRNRVGNNAGGIANAGVLVMRDSVVRRNRSWYSGGISNIGTATLIRTRVTHNRAEDQGDGGGIGNGGTLTLVDSVVARNRVDGGAAGISNSGPLHLIRSSVRDNRSGGLDLDDAGGGGIQNSGELVLTDSHVTRNSVARGPGSGGGIYNWPDDGTVTLEGTSSVTGNTPDDCVGTTAC